MTKARLSQVFKLVKVLNLGDKMKPNKFKKVNKKTSMKAMIKERAESNDNRDYGNQSKSGMTAKEMIEKGMD